MDKKTKKNTKNQTAYESGEKIFLIILGAAVIGVAIYLLYYYFHYTRYVKYKDSLSSYEYEEGGVFNAVPENSADVPGMQLAAEMST